jgi:hypothetical protein
MKLQEEAAFENPGTLLNTPCPWFLLFDLPKTRSWVPENGKKI